MALILTKGDAFILTGNYLHLDKGTVCECLESECDTDAEFCVLASTPSGTMLIPTDRIRPYTQDDHKRIYGG